MFAVHMNYFQQCLSNVDDLRTAISRLYAR